MRHVLGFCAGGLFGRWLAVGGDNLLIISGIFFCASVILYAIKDKS